MPRVFRSALLSLATCGGALLATPASAFDVCGNGICATNAVPPENSVNCPADCGGGVDECPDDRCEKGSCSRPAAGTDEDADGVPDRLEYDLAHKFFPSVLLQSHSEDRSESYLYANRAAPYTLRPYISTKSLCNTSFECLEIRWGIPFFYDHGDTFLDLTEHQGDSELYAALLRRTTTWSSAQTDASAWVMIRDYTSAHTGGRVGAYGCKSCRLYGADSAACNAQPNCTATTGHCGGHSACANSSDQAQCVSWGCTWTQACLPKSAWTCYSDAPRASHATIYCAESKHALYHTDSECDGGAILNADDCPTNKYDMRSWKTGRLQNVGNAGAHAAFDTTIQHPSHCGYHDVWSDGSFGETTPYKQKFTSPFNWALE